MANSKTHALVGLGVGVGLYLIWCKAADRKVDLGETLLAGCAGLFMGLLPDILEPALDPNHRRFFHSWSITALIIEGNRRSWENPKLTPEQRAGIALSSAGYLSHLLLDGATPKGLPLI